MENKEDLELQARELWSQAQTKKEIAYLKIESAKGLIGDPKGSAKLRVDASEHLEEYLDLRRKANNLYRQAEGFLKPKTKDQFKAIK